MNKASTDAINARKEIKEIVIRELKPVFSDFHPSSNQYLLYKKYDDIFALQDIRILEFLYNHSNFCNTFKLAAESSKVSGDSVSQGHFLNAITYLLETEVIGTVYIDRILLLLIGKGVDLHLEPDYDHRYTRHAKCLEDLQMPSLSLANKLEFLRANNVSFFSKWIDRNLRNKIAHLDFEIVNQRFIMDPNGRKTQVNLQNKIQIFTEYYNEVVDFFNQQLKRT